MTQSKLNQIIAVEKDVKSTTTRSFTDLHHKLQKSVLLSGISRTYQPKDEDGDQLPPESTKVQVTVEDVLKDASAVLSRLFDVTATKDFGNVKAGADVVVDGNTLLSGVPVPYLLFLEKQLVDLGTFVAKLPVLDQGETWEWDDNSNSYRTAVYRATRTKKVPRNHVKAEATEKHPAQVEIFHEDVIVGTWSTVKFSGALPAARVRELVERVDKLKTAVKYAREEANSLQVDNLTTGTVVFDYLFGA